MAAQPRHRAVAIPCTAYKHRSLNLCDAFYTWRAVEMSRTEALDLKRREEQSVSGASSSASISAAASQVRGTRDDEVFCIYILSAEAEIAAKCKQCG